MEDREIPELYFIRKDEAVGRQKRSTVGCACKWHAISCPAGKMPRNV